MLIEQGFAGLSMDRLAEATEYSKGTVYQHFSTKEDLVMALASQTMERRASLFERVARFQGRSRERMQGIGIADELFARLYPHSFRSELIIKMAELEGRASPDRREALLLQEGRCLGLVMGLVEEAIASGDLPATVSIPQIALAVASMAIGTHTIVSNFRSLMGELRVNDPFLLLQDNIQILLDGFGWKPLSTEWDYAETRRRIAKEVFSDEFQSASRE
jgi:AcrR family transcriptional regulator